MAAPLEIHMSLKAKLVIVIETVIDGDPVTYQWSKKEAEAIKDELIRALGPPLPPRPPQPPPDAPDTSAHHTREADRNIWTNYVGKYS